MEFLSFLDSFVAMNWFTALFILIIGMLLLWFGSELVVREIQPIARYFKVKELVITILGVSILSSLAELAVSSFAALQGKSDISIGNIVGANFLTLTFVTAVAALISPLRICTEIKERESTWMLLSSAVILVLAADGVLSRVDGALLMLLYVPYLFVVIKDAVNKSKSSRQATITDKKSVRSREKILPHIVLGILAILGIVIGAELALRAGENISERFGITQLVLGVLILAFLTSLPELGVAIAAVSKKKADITLGEIYASNIFTALFILGFCCLIVPINVSDDVLRFDIPMLILSGVIVQIFITTGSKLVRLEALLILMLYIYFVLGHFIRVPNW